MGNVRKRWAALAAVLCAGLGLAQPGVAPRALTGAESQAVTSCLALVRGCQLADGAFAQVRPGGTTSAPVWVAPYFASYAALALLAGEARAKNAEDLNRVGRWLAWCARNQSADGYWHDFEGPPAGLASNGKIDAWDSSAALFLLVAGRYHRAGGPATPALAAAAKRALACIGQVTDSDGLTWATPTHRIKYLMDNVEVCAGLRAAAAFFAATGFPAEARQAGERAERLAKKLPDFWISSDTLYAYALHPDGKREGGLGQPYPHGLAQLFGIAFIAPQTSAWVKVNTACAPETGPSAAAGAEWWLVAASRLGENEAKAWRAKLVKEVTAFTPHSVYLHRPALALLGLLEGADWMTR